MSYSITHTQLARFRKLFEDLSHKTSDRFQTRLDRLSRNPTTDRGKQTPSELDVGRIITGRVVFGRVHQFAMQNKRNSKHWHLQINV